MSLNQVILLLRIAAAALLYLFLLGVVAMMWRDWRAVAQANVFAQAAQRREAAARPPGRSTPWR